MRDSVPGTSYSSVCNVLRQWNISLIPTYRVYRLYDIVTICIHTILRLIVRLITTVSTLNNVIIYIIIYIYIYIYIYIQLIIVFHLFV